MTRSCTYAGIALLTLALVAFMIVPAGAGNGAPSGSHYNLNIIGVPKDKTSAMDLTKRHTIFVKLWGKTSIWLTEGDYQVLDGNGTDSDGAAFQLPNPDPDNDGVTEYSVYVRALGKPYGGAEITTCVQDKATGEILCSLESVELYRSKGKQSFENVSKELLTACLDTDDDNLCDTRIFLFDSNLYNYLWEYDNWGLRLAQLRFYEVATEVGLGP